MIFLVHVHSLLGSSVVGFSSKEYWSGLPFPSPGDLPDLWIKPISPALAGTFFMTELPRKPIFLTVDMKLMR